MERDYSLRWLESTGGPLLLVETYLLPHWQGYSSSSQSGLSDYERACKVDDYLGTIAVNVGDGIVFGGEPFRTTWWQPEGRGSGLFVRWVAAENEREIVESLIKVEQSIWKSTTVEFNILKGNLILFDSSASSTEIDSWISLELAPGRYTAETCMYDPNEVTSLILHRLVPMQANDSLQTTS